MPSSISLTCSRALGDEPAHDRVEQQHDADDGEQHPALDAEARQQPLNQPRSRLLISAFRSRASNATSSRASSREALARAPRHVDRAMAAAGAADADRELRLAFGDVARKQEVQQIAKSSRGTARAPGHLSMNAATGRVVTRQRLRVPAT